MLRPSFWARDFSRVLLPEAVNYTVTAMSWRAIGGCETASIVATGDENTLAAMFNKLRCPVEIYDSDGNGCWWGYVSAVRIKIGAIEIVATLDEMANTVAVAYSFIEPGTQQTGTRKTTAWATDTASIDEYGVKEFLSSMAGVTDAVAENKRDTLLARLKLPLGILTASNSSVNQPTVQLDCRGWWETLAWRYYPEGFPVGPSYTITAGSTTQTLGQTGGPLMIQQDFEPGDIPFTPASVSLYVSKTATAPANPITVLIIKKTIVGGLSLNQTVFSGEIAVGSVGTSIGWVSCTATTKKEMVSQDGVTYTLLVFGETSADGTSYYTFGVNEGLGYTSGAMRVNNTISLIVPTGAARSPDADLLFQVVADTTTNTRLLLSAALSYDEFITSSNVETATGIDLSPYQDGDSLLKDMVEELMAAGGPNGRPLNSEVDEMRRVRVWEEPDDTPTYIMDRTGVITTVNGGSIRPCHPPVGVYVRVADLLLSDIDLGLVADPTLQFIEGAKWSNGAVSFTFRGERTEADFNRVSLNTPSPSIGYRPPMPTIPRVGL